MILIINNLKRILLFCCVTLGLQLVPYWAKADTKYSYYAKRPFGVARSRLNILEPERIPITEIPTRAISRDAFIPPRIRRQGFIPRVSVVEEYNDNILFDSATILKDFITRISPGFDFIKYSERSYFELDYSLESAIYPDNSKLNNAFEAHNLVTSGSFRLSKKTTLSFSETFFSFLDSARQSIPGLTARKRANENYLNINLIQALVPKTELYIAYTQILNHFEDKNAVTSLIHEGRLLLSNQVTPQNKLAMNYRYRFINFESVNSSSRATTFNNNQDGMIHIVSVNNIHEFSETFIATAEMGAAFIVEPLSNTNIIGGISLKASTKNTSAEISYERDITTVGGFGTLLKVDMISANIETSLMNKLYGGLTLDLTRYKQINGSGIEIKMLEPIASLEYKISKQLQLRFAYIYLRQKVNVGNEITDSNRINLGFVASF